MSLLEIRDLGKSFEGRPIIRDISLDLEEGETLALLGDSGVGKSTLFNVIAGFLRPDQGDILLDGRSILGQTGHFSYMLQKDLLLPHMKIVDNVSLPLRIRGIAKKEAREKANPYFREFGLEGTQTFYPAQLSGGMRQRAAFLRTYLADGRIMLLDEPFSALDGVTKKDLITWYREAKDHFHLTTLFITHDIEEALLLADEILLLQGKPGTISRRFRPNLVKKEGMELEEDFFRQKTEIITCFQEGYSVK